MLGFLDWQWINLDHLPGHVEVDFSPKTGLLPLFQYMPMLLAHKCWILCFSMKLPPRCNNAASNPSDTGWAWGIGIVTLNGKLWGHNLQSSWSFIILSFSSFLFFIYFFTRFYGGSSIKAFSKKPKSPEVTKMASGCAYLLSLLFKLSRQKIAWSGDHVALLG